MASNRAAYAALAGVREQLRALASGRAAREVRQAIAGVVPPLIERSFAAQSSPDGAPWAPRKAGGGRRLLIKSGRLRDSWRARPTARGIAVTSTADYAAAHQAGVPRRGLPARRMLPRSDRPLPPRWAAAFVDAAARALAPYLPR